jgi:hypothetical protein
MWVNTRRLGLLLASLLLIAVAVVACATPQPTASTSSSSGENGANVFRTPNESLNTATPTFPGFTMGAWPSQYSPGNNDTITIYVICRIQDPTMLTPPKPASGVSVTITFNQMNGQNVNLSSQVVQTGSDGIAAFTVQLNDPASGIPVQVLALTTYNGTPYTAQTFFTPNPLAATPTVTGQASPGATSGP